MKISWHGHSVVKIITADEKVILIDPFITGNQLCDLKAETEQADFILLTHAHNDHVGDTLTIAKKSSALVIANVELADFLESRGLNTHGLQPGGSFIFPFGKVTMTPAIHSSSYTDADGTNYPLGIATGLVINLEGKTIYHAGDTALFSDMQLIGNKFSIDLAFVPIGDNFTMGPEDAVQAVKWLKPKRVVPIHYNTFPLIKQDPQIFVNELGDTGIVPNIGESLSL
ncbi:metal-dependent hydrolase [Vagococcus elongatus]|uniref:UPF0173 metal-dependent hydrolase CBF29_03875 n=1 Tax=Vagococcus elongatus TaxID=180344 RepID=A0A430B1D3_9ENTE|nr:metal-dependent hydrolase [Vagococcus elongatus]RSU14032.1 metal-dependent hydrolase [Vagococcus elongatus]